MFVVDIGAELYPAILRPLSDIFITAAETTKVVAMEAQAHVLQQRRTNDPFAT